MLRSTNIYDFCLCNGDTVVCEVQSQTEDTAYDVEVTKTVFCVRCVLGQGKS